MPHLRELFHDIPAEELEKSVQNCGGNVDLTSVELTC